MWKKAIKLDQKAYKDETLMAHSKGANSGLMPAKICTSQFMTMKKWRDTLTLSHSRQRALKNSKTAMSDDEIEASDILPYHKGENLCLLMSIVVDKKYQNGKTIKLLTNALFDKNNSLAKEKKYITQILAEYVSDDGKKYVTRTLKAKKSPIAKMAKYSFALLKNKKHASI